MRRNKDGDWQPSIRKIGGKHYIEMEEIIEFFAVRAEMRSQELDEWFSNNDVDEPGVVEVAAEIDGSMEELDYLVKVFNYFQSVHDLNRIKNLSDLEKLLEKPLDKTVE